MQNQGFNWFHRVTSVKCGNQGHRFGLLNGPVSRPFENPTIETWQIWAQHWCKGTCFAVRERRATAQPSPAAIRALERGRGFHEFSLVTDRMIGKSSIHDDQWWNCMELHGIAWNWKKIPLPDWMTIGTNWCRRCPKLIQIPAGCLINRGVTFHWTNNGWMMAIGIQNWPL